MEGYETPHDNYRDYQATEQNHAQRISSNYN
jgi:hypothetical protein